MNFVMSILLLLTVKLKWRNQLGISVFISGVAKAAKESLGGLGLLLHPPSPSLHIPLMDHDQAC